ncbi:ABA4-like family protein [Candidatus Pelagibacter communis]|uniref:ABA4-like family protein n=1 Tax=Pelagibacter ubique TaxID=198252 RepID=UPI00094C71EC|nr:ABA4-like family protein [Candidatus Pelagibacter ubique]|tara:strand:+ start:1324 stop:1797 length:474 start_codon:yes stop_codon:yes gene_type:complete
MIEQIYNYFTLDMLYLWVNIGVLPFWMLIIFFPQSHVCKYLATSIFPIFLLSGVYIFVLYKAYLGSFDFDANFKLYKGLIDVSELFEDNYFLLMFWTHFVAINLFVGGWILKDSQKFLINKILLGIPLIITYLIGPVGLFFYWVIRIFYAKRINLYD